ncbi:MAG: hypothetical protein ACK56G_07520, partial [Pirellulaceae bacterium]
AHSRSFQPPPSQGGGFFLAPKPRDRRSIYRQQKAKKQPGNQHAITTNCRSQAASQTGIDRRHQAETNPSAWLGPCKQLSNRTGGIHSFF